MKASVEQIDALLPQTQCGLCSYAGCRPYAEAIATQNEKLNRCPPGGVKTLKALGNLLQIDVSACLSDMQVLEKKPVLAKINEDLCIGCTKCIKACPVDAIIGAAKQMHTILADECTGCELCIPPCPMDCIELLPLEKSQYQVEQARDRYSARQQRLAEPKADAVASPSIEIDVDNKLKYIQDAVARVRLKKQQ